MKTAQEIAAEIERLLIQFRAGTDKESVLRAETIGRIKGLAWSLFENPPATAGDAIIRLRSGEWATIDTLSSPRFKEPA